MKTLISLLAVAAVCSIGAGTALAHSTTASPKAVTVVMHDPGCHWFSVGGKLQAKASVAGPVSLKNYDEAAIKIAGAGAVKKVAVGKSILLGKGHYTITMVGQASDDNHLKLTVS